MSRGKWIAALVLGLAGCSAPAQPPAQPPAPPPPPPATRALVGWAESMCTQAKQFDEIRKNFDDLAGRSDMAGAMVQAYLLSVQKDVDGLIKTVKETQPSGIEAADAHAAAFVKALEGIRPQLPSEQDPAIYQAPAPEALAKAKQVAAVVATVDRQGPALVALAGKTPGLTSSYNVAPACEPVPQHDEQVRKLVLWSDSMCEATETLARERVDPLDDPALADPRFAQFAGVRLAQYISSPADRLGQVERQLSALQPTGIAAADEYRTATLDAVTAALPKIPRRDMSLDRLPIEELKKRATQVAETLTSLKPKEPGLDDIAAREPELAKAYALAPGCEPPKTETTPTMPVAANGTDISACQSGKCQIQVNGSVDMTVNGFKFTIKVVPSGVTITHDSGLLQLGSNGQGSFGNKDRGLRFTVAGVDGTTAVVDISS